MVSSLRSLLQAMRLHHWIKNLIVWSAPFFALKLNQQTAIYGLLAFGLFSFTASAFYLINDIRDVERDRQHPRKKMRPIASGMLSVRLAGMVAFILLSITAGLSWWISPNMLWIWLAYVVMQAGYNLGLKREPILDLMILALGYVLRALGGAAATNVPVSGWFVLCLGLLALFLGIEKRKAELLAVGHGGETRSVLQHYTADGLQRMESVVTASALMSYALWTIEAGKSIWMMATLPFVIYAIFRFQMLSENEETKGIGETPEQVFLHDKGMIIAVIGWLVSVFLVLKWNA
jgi:4-hydroxybenzoate polyprenyltransferase